jgi:hypothetical protein
MITYFFRFFFGLSGKGIRLDTLLEPTPMADNAPGDTHPQPNVS